MVNCYFSNSTRFRAMPTCRHCLLSLSSSFVCSRLCPSAPAPPLPGCVEIFPPICQECVRPLFSVRHCRTLLSSVVVVRCCRPRCPRRRLLSSSSSMVVVVVIVVPCHLPFSSSLFLPFPDRLTKNPLVNPPVPHAKSSMSSSIVVVVVLDKNFHVIVGRC